MQFVVNVAEKLRHGNVKRLLLLLLLLLPLLPLVSSVCFLGWFVKRLDGCCYPLATHRCIIIDN